MNDYQIETKGIRPCSFARDVAANIKLMSKHHGELCRADFCQYNMSCRKATRFLVFNAHPLQQHLKVCRGKGLCTRTNLPHVILSGTDDKGVCLTLKAQPYPISLCNQLVKHVVPNHPERFAVRG